jgi:hypothetical protein
MDEYIGALDPPRRLNAAATPIRRRLHPRQSQGPPVD